MSRSGYVKDCENWDLIRWRGAVASAIRGKRGQAFLREILAALDAMPVKRLIAHELKDGGEVCALGAVAAKRGMTVDSLDPENLEAVAKAFGISEALAAEIAFENDEEFCYWRETTPESRWRHMREWVAKQIVPDHIASGSVGI